MKKNQKAGNLPTDVLLSMYEQALLIRNVEIQLGADFKNGKLPGPVHLYIGQEAIAVGICQHLSDSDWIASTHRGHGHFIAKGGNIKKLLAEVYGRNDGICHGFGGSMHVADFSKGIIGANGIVAGGIGISAGAALAAQLDNDGNVAIAFFGDGAANQGVLCEALNISSLWKLPLILVCENNGFSEFSPSSTVTAGSIVDRANPYKVPGILVDGNDTIDVWQAGNIAIERARSGGGPTLIEARTYRHRGHVEAEYSFLSEEYRSESEVEKWKERGPLPLLKQQLLNEGISENQLNELSTAVLTDIKEAVDFADKSPWPEKSQATKFMFK